MSLPPPFQPEPDPQNPKDDDGRQADPERDVNTPCRHLYPEEDSKQLRKGHQPEHDRRDEPRLPLHPGVFLDDGLVRRTPTFSGAAFVARPPEGTVRCHPMRLPSVDDMIDL